MKRRSFDQPGHAHFLTFSVYRRQALFHDARMCRAFLAGLASARVRQRFEIWAYVLMPEHVHLLIWSEEEEFRISRALSDIKQPFARSVLAEWEREEDARFDRYCHEDARGRRVRRIWQAGGGYDRNIFTTKAALKVMEYIHTNPIRAGLVEAPEEYPWSSAAWHLGLPSEFEADPPRLY